MSRSTLADQLIAVLLEAGVERVYGVVGDSLNPVVDAIRRTDGIEWVHVRNEEAADSQPTRQLRLAAGKVVLDGGVGKMVELARANVRSIPNRATL